MKKIAAMALGAVVLVLGGCGQSVGISPGATGMAKVAEPADTSNASKIAPNVDDGPGGGQVNDLTSPVGNAVLSQASEASAVFPQTAPPAGSNVTPLGQPVVGDPGPNPQPPTNAPMGG